MKILYKLLLYLGLLWTFSITILRGIRWPNDWAEAHWLISYQFGFIKRGLPGTLLKPFLNPDNSNYSLAVIRLATTSLLLIFFIGLFWICSQVIKKSQHNTYSVFIVLLFLTSPYITMSAYLNGYFDNILILISIIASWLIMKEKTALAGIAISIGLLTHETMFTIGFPPVALIAFMYFIKNRAINDSGYWQLLSGFVKQHALLLFLPLAVFLFIVLNQNLLLDVKHIENKLITHVTSYDIVQNGKNIQVPKSHLTSFNKYFELHSSSFISKITNLLYFTHILFPLLILLTFCWQSLKGVTLRKTIFFIVLFITLIPLTLHAIAIDTSRIWTYPLIVAMLALWGIKESFPNRQKKQEESPFFIQIMIMVVVLHILIVTPLMDDQKELLSQEIRIILYTPALLLISWLFSKNHNQHEQATIKNLQNKPSNPNKYTLM